MRIYVYKFLFIWFVFILCMVFLLSHGHIVTQRRLWNIQNLALTSQDWGHVCSPTWWKGNIPQVLCRTFSSHMPHRQSLADEGASPSHRDVNVGIYSFIFHGITNPALTFICLENVLCMVFLLSHGHIVTQRRLWNIQSSALTSQDWGHVYSPTWWKGNTPQVLCRTFSSHTPHRQSLADKDRSPSHRDVNVGFLIYEMKADGKYNQSRFHICRVLFTLSVKSDGNIEKFKHLVKILFVLQTS